MSKAETPQRWFEQWRPRARPTDIDAADVGTAFGLDLSLNELTHAPQRSAATAPQPGWLRRLAARRKSTA